jgi:glutamate--cysteine ligase
MNRETSCSAADLDLPQGIAQCALLEQSSLENIFVEKQTLIETWFRQQWQNTPPVVTSSVDLRNEGFRLAPVDTNLFPAGFNNLNPDFLPLCIQAAQGIITQKMPRCTRILIIPENHTRNTFYFESLVNLHDIFSKAGFEVRIGSLIEGLKTPQAIPNSSLFLEPVIRQDNKICVANFFPCLILLNNDLSDGIPEILQGIEQSMYPDPKLGWSHRLKSRHFKHYHDIAEEFSAKLSIDPWRISPLFNASTGVNFMDSTGIDELTGIVDELLTKIKRKYEEYNIQHEPFVVIKADAGTYGMGIMMVKSADEIKQLNRKQRTKMSTSKGNQTISKVIIQEGVYTFETAGTPPNVGVAEPVIYLLGQYVIGGFYRIHKDKGKDDNLNMPGMHFEPLAFNSACNNPQQSVHEPNACPNRFYAYSVVARLASLAAAREATEI